MLIVGAHPVIHVYTSLHASLSPSPPPPPPPLPSPLPSPLVIHVYTSLHTSLLSLCFLCKRKHDKINNVYQFFINVNNNSLK